MIANKIISQIRKLSPNYVLGVAIIIVSTFLIMGAMINRVAIDPEALANFRFMRELSLIDIWTDQTVPGAFVTFRPVKQSFLRIIYLIVGINPPVFFAVNILMVGIVAILIYEIVFRKTHQMLPALIAELQFLTDWRLQKPVYTIGEVQITLAAVFGLSAIWTKWFGKGKFRPYKVSLLLLFSALSKEFGIAFALAIFIDALIAREKQWKKFMGSAIGAVIIFTGLRLWLAIVPSSSIEYSSFLNRIKWYTFNVFNGFFFTFINLFQPPSDGELPALDNIRYSIAEARGITLFQIVPIIVFVALAFLTRENRRYSIPIFFLLLGNSLLFFWRYAYRFHFLGVVAVFILVGFGINHIFKKLLIVPKQLDLLIIFNMLVAIMLLWRGVTFKNELNQIVRQTDRSICSEIPGFSEGEIESCLRNRSICIPPDEYYSQSHNTHYYSYTDQETVKIVMDYYDMPQKYCTCQDPTSNCE